MSKVFFFSYARSSSPIAGIERLFKKTGFEETIGPGQDVAVKLHMGELGNVRYLRPVFVRKVVDIVKARGGKPFLIDTVAAYPGERETKEKYLRSAEMNGFTEASIGAPVMIADDSDPHVTIPVKERLDDCALKEIRVPAAILDAGSFIVLTHVKGHELTGMGGALKNLGMGCVSRKTKQDQHMVNMPQFENEAECDGCGRCAEGCPTGAITIVEKKPERAVSECTACGTCHFRCPSNCWVWPPGAHEKLQLYMGHVAANVVSGYKGQIGFMNFVQDVTPHCDCAAPSGRPIVQDVGIAFSLDPVSADKCSLDLIDQAPIIPGATSLAPPDILGKLRNTSSLVQMQTAQKLGTGEMEYELVNI